MEDLATAHCYRRIHQSLEVPLDTITWADKNSAEMQGANQGTISLKKKLSSGGLFRYIVNA